MRDFLVSGGNFGAHDAPRASLTGAVSVKADVAGDTRRIEVDAHDLTLFSPDRQPRAHAQEALSKGDVVDAKKVPVGSAASEPVPAPARDSADPRLSVPAEPRSPLAGGPAELDLRLRADPRGPRVSTGGGEGPSAGPGRGPGGLPPGLEHAGQGTYRYEDRGFVADIDRDGTVHFRDRAPVGFSSPLSLAFDLTEAVMMLRDDDPYRPGKMKFLEETRELRARLCGEAHTERLRQALFALPKELDRAWRDTSQTPEARRRLLFQRWDECADTRGDDELARAGALARATVLAYIRQHLPAGSAHAYTHDELLALNAVRVSREPFAPYEAATPPPDRRPDGGT